MTVDTKTVQGRRSLSFKSLDEIVADAERLASSPTTKTLGNWPLGRLFMHLAGAVNGSIDGFTVRAPWYIRLIGPFIKSRIINKGMPAGFKLSKKREDKLFPPAESTQEGLEKLRAAVERTRKERMTAAHPVFGKLTHEEWTRLHLRHSEMHLSFAVPG